MTDDSQVIRRPAVAGMFYPANAVELAKTVAGLYSEVDKVALDGRPMGLIAPHAGYPYSGRIAAKAFKLIEGESYDSVVVISPSHTVFFKGASVFNGDAYQTPLGDVAIDKELSKKIASISPCVYLSNQGHASGSTRGEHALEVQLPFLQIALSDFKLVAIVVGDQEEDTIRGLGETLAATLTGRNALIVASTDLSHFHSDKKARKLDFTIQTAIEKFDPEQLITVLDSGRGEACGGGPVAAMMIATRRLGGSNVQFLDYATSASTTGDFDEVVGYLSAAVVAGEQARTISPVLGTPEARPAKAKDLTDDDRAELRRIARDAIEARLAGRDYVAPESEGLSVTKGIFVTLKVNGETRGSIGRMRSEDPLYQLVADIAPAAAFDDPRCDAVTADELDKLDIVISILSPLKRVHDVNDIKVGKHGLMIKLDMHTGMSLPYVAVENDWSLIEFLEQTCLKAGLPKNSYKEKRAEIYSFTAEII